MAFRAYQVASRALHSGGRENIVPKAGGLRQPSRAMWGYGCGDLSEARARTPDEGVETLVGFLLQDAVPSLKFAFVPTHGSSVKVQSPQERWLTNNSERLALLADSIE